MSKSLFSFGYDSHLTAPGKILREKIISAADGVFLDSICRETWDTSHAAESGYVDCMMPLSDVDLSVVLDNAGAVKLNFDTSIYDSNQAANAGPVWMVEVDGQSNPCDLITVGPGVAVIASPLLPPGRHRVKFIQVANMGGSGRWAAHDPQLSRVTGVTLPDDAILDASQRPTSWFLPIADSIGEGAVNINKTRLTFRDPDHGIVTNAYYGWVSLAARLLIKSVAGYLISGIGIVRGGVGTPHGALNTENPEDDPWDHIFSGVLRPFATAPDFILLCVGTNDWATDPNTVGGEIADPTSTDVSFAANVKTFFARVRAHSVLARTPIYVSVPFGGFKRTAMQNAVAAYKEANPDEGFIELFDVAFGSRALEGSDEMRLFAGLTKNRPDDLDTIPSPEASDRIHPYGIGTDSLGSVNACERLARVIAPRLAAMLAGDATPETGGLALGPLWVEQQGERRRWHAPLATGGSAPYSYQFQTSADQGKTWTDLGASISNMQSAISGVSVGDDNAMKSARYRLVVTDSAQPKAQAVSILAEAKE